MALGGGSGGLEAGEVGGGAAFVGAAVDRHEAEVSGDFGDEVFGRAGAEVGFELWGVGAFAQFGVELWRLGVFGFVADLVFDGAEDAGAGVDGGGEGGAVGVGVHAGV